MVSLMARVVSLYFRMSGRQRRYDDPESFERHLEECREINAKRYVMPSSWDFGTDVTVRDYEGHPCYILNEGKERAVLYLHGGSGIHQMLKYHYRFIKRMIAAADVTVYVPIYPLAPNYTYKDTYRMLEPIYDGMCSEHPRITVMGDSMGGNIALALSEHVARKPDSTVLLSPFLDMTVGDPRYREYYRREPRLAMYELHRCGELWSGGDDPHDPMISPIFGDIKGLDMTLFVGTQEVLLLDSERLRDRAKGESVPVHYYEYEGMSHVFPLQPIPEAKKAFPEIMSHIA